MNNMMKNNKTKGLQDFLTEDASLTEKVTYEEFQNRKAAPNNTDDMIAEAYKAYRDALEKLQCEKSN